MRIVLALGGASWSRLGSDGAWVPVAGSARRAQVAPLQPSNCGFDVAPTGPARTGWSDHLRQRFAGQPLKTVAARATGRSAVSAQPNPDEARSATSCPANSSSPTPASKAAWSMPSAPACATPSRPQGEATLLVDLLPQHTPAQVLAEAAPPARPAQPVDPPEEPPGPAGPQDGPAARTAHARSRLADPVALAQAIKALPLPLARPRPLDEAISTAGGVRFEALDARGMLRAVPGVFCAGEMLDWEAPTGGYLLTACLATGRAAGAGALRWLAARDTAG